LENGVPAAFDDWPHEARKLRTRQVQLEVLCHPVPDAQERQADVCCGRGRQLDLRHLAGFAQSCNCRWIAANVETSLLLEAVGQVFQDSLVHIGSAELRVAARRLDLEHPLPNSMIVTSSVRHRSR
jgi:hypothetical protein